MNLAVVGSGYVGLVSGACFAEMGHQVTCVDIDAAKIEQLRRGDVRIYEPGLKLLVQRNIEQARLFFTTELTQAIADAAIIFIAVGTPAGEDGSADLSHVLAVARTIGTQLDGYRVIVTKSTVPVGTADQVRETIADTLAKRGVQHEFDVVSNPEFLKQGAAVEDFMKPDRIIIGTDSVRARGLLRDLYKDFTRNHDRILSMGIRDAEMTKYVGNAMLATKISYMNEIANLCDKLGVDVENVRLGIGADSRIGYSFIYPGCGYGGSCFPKDVRALIHAANQHGCEPLVLQAVHERNEAQKRILFTKIVRYFGCDLSGLTFGLWGLAFKPGTDDMREAPAVALLHELLGSGATVRAYDPEAMDTARTVLPAAWFEHGQLTLVSHQYEAVDGVDALILVTEWKPFRHPNFAAMKARMKQPLIFDGRNQYDPGVLQREGFQCVGIGRGGQRWHAPGPVETGP